jgi:hypothetical protein
MNYLFLLLLLVSASRMGEDKKEGEVDIYRDTPVR